MLESGIFAREDNSREAVEVPEYHNLLGNLGIGLSVKDLRIAQLIPPFSVTWCFDRRCVVELHSLLTSSVDTRV